MKSTSLSSGVRARPALGTVRRSQTPIGRSQPVVIPKSFFYGSRGSNYGRVPELSASDLDALIYWSGALIFSPSVRRQWFFVPPATVNEDEWKIFGGVILVGFE